MRVMRAEPNRFTDVTTKSVGAVWRAYDLQLTVFAVLLGAIGLVMAYTNSVEAGESVLRSGTTFTRALMWSGLAIVVFMGATLFDYRWLKTLRWPIWFANLGLLLLTLAIGTGVGGSSRWINIGPLTFQFSELAKILMIIVLAAYLGNREGKLDSLGSILGAMPPHGAARRARHAPAGPRDLARPRGDPRRHAVHVRGQPALAARHGARRARRDPDRLDLHPARLPEGPDPLVPQSRARTHRAPAGRSTQAQITVGSGGFLGTGLTNGTQTRGEFLPVQESDFVFAVLAQELGFIGALVVFLLYGALLWRILACAWASRDPFGTPVRRPGSRRCSCSSCSSTWAWSSA